MQINKVKCDECGEEVVPEIGAKVISMTAVLGGEPLDFCSPRCAKQFLTKLNHDEESERIKGMAAEHNAQQSAIKAAGIDPSQVADLKVLS